MPSKSRDAHDLTLLPGMGQAEFTPVEAEATAPGGSSRQLPVGLCYLEVAGRRVVSKVLIGSDETIMGVLDMEAMGIRVDPVTGTVEFTRGYAVRA